MNTINLYSKTYTNHWYTHTSLWEVRLYLTFTGSNNQSWLFYHGIFVTRSNSTLPRQRTFNQYRMLIDNPWCFECLRKQVFVQELKVVLKLKGSLLINLHNVYDTALKTDFRQQDLLTPRNSTVFSLTDSSNSNSLMSGFTSLVTFIHFVFISVIISLTFIGMIPS